jgi:trehalose 6-phosphate phosphatase
VGLRRLAEGTVFAGRRPVFAGDDRTDEDAIAAAQALGGDGIRVGDAETAARYRLRDVAAVYDWLQASREALQRAREPA